MWTNKLMSHNVEQDELYVQFTSDSGNTFTKIYKGMGMIDRTNNTCICSDINAINQFLADRLTEMEENKNTYQTISGMVNQLVSIVNGWEYKITYVNMPFDWVEVFVDFILPDGSVCSRMYGIQQHLSTNDVYSWITNEQTKVSNWILTENYEELSSYLGREVTA